ncbi:helix-turn-helix transcriptional regulator [Kitasatospora sp. LaBMicrA B282]|uniref:helix-turn-helix transcriptional regulator n=1 Tax=Kitasatospora sp. LaBMicrA B282 TaxID=3420949 RepID=UPI003D147325
MTSDRATPEGTGVDALDGIESVSVLGDPSRRSMYAFIRRAGRPVTRDEAAASIGISRKLAAFHLDKLVDAGLLRARYGAPDAERRVGRRPKVYEPTDAEIAVTIPDRRHELLAELLLAGVTGETAGRTAAQAATEAAATRGRRLGEQQRAQSRPGRLGAERGLTLCERMLDAHGYEPVREGPTRVRLHNCPFHPLATQTPELVCGLNHAFLAGYLEGLDAAGVRAELAPRAGECCVVLSGA